MRIRWLTEALADMQAIKGYIAEQNPVAAQQVIASIRRDVISLTDQPNIGRIGRLPETRKLVINQYPYIVAYREQRDEVHILCRCAYLKALAKNTCTGINNAARSHHLRQPTRPPSP